MIFWGGIDVSKKVNKSYTNYEIFSTEVSVREKQGQNSGGSHQGVIGSL